MPKVSFEEGIKLKSDKNKADRQFNFIFKKDPSSFHVYTDGSKNQTVPFGGFAVCFNYDKCLLFRSCAFASIFSLEAMAILESLKYILNNNLPYKKYMIFSDSESVLKSISSYVKTNKCSYLILKIKELVKKLERSGKIIIFYWIPAHFNIKGNELADVNAKQAIRKGVDTQELIPSTDFKGYWKNLMKEELHEWFMNYKALNKGRYYFENFYDISRDPWFVKYNLERKAIVSINRLRSNHSSLKSSLFRKDIVSDDTCDCDMRVEQTSEHIIFQCNLFDKERRQLMKVLVKKFSFFHVDLTAILRCNDSEITYALSKFINSIKIQI